MPPLSLCLLLLALVPLCHGGAPTPTRTPIQAVLLKAVEAGHVNIGDPIYAKVELAWGDSNCKLREGAILKGRIIGQTARTKVVKSSEISLLFDSGQCGGRDMKPLPLIVASVLAPDPTWGTSLYGNEQGRSLTEAPGLSLGGGTSPMSLGAGGGSNMRSMLDAAATVLLEPPTNKPPQLVMPGQVVGLGDMKLGVGKGPEGSSVLSSEKHNLRLDSGSRLVLVPNVNVSTAAAPPSAPDSSGNPGPAVSAPPANTEAEDDAAADACLPPACSVALGETQPEASTTAADFTLPVRQLGFSIPPDREMYDLDHNVAISYLGPNKLLFTFNPHSLVPRTGSDAGLPKLHMVRAVLIDVQTRKVIRTVDWRVHDARQYLWSLGRDTVLVHAGGELRVYGPDLKVQQKLVLNGPLAFARVAPSGGYVAVGTIRERHSEAIHNELAEAEGREPEEDVEVRVLDANFQVLTTVQRSSRDVPPVLSEGGEIRVPTIGKNRWRIAEYTWTGQKRVLKQVSSTCRPEVSSLPPNLLFVTGCDRMADGKWYRILRPDGKPVLRGDSPSNEQGQNANGVVGSSLFAVGITELTKALDPSSPFHTSDLKNLHVNVYQVENGKKVTGWTIPGPLPTVQTFALSPDNRHVAIVENDQIVFYALPFVPASTGGL